MAITDVRSNKENLAAAPTSDWTPNLKGKDIQPDLIEAIRRLHENQQNQASALAKANETIKQLQAPTDVPAPVLTTFVEFTLGSPETGAVRFRTGRGTPEGVVEGSAQKDIYYRLDGGIGTFMYIKTAGQGKTGWTATL